MADNTIEIDISLQLDNINRQLDSLKNNAEKQGKELGGNIAKGVVIGLAAFEIGKAGFKAIGNALSEAIAESVQAEKALNLFNQSLANAGNFSEGASLKFQKFAESLQKTTGISDDLIISNASILASLGRLSGEGLERATQAAVDFAATGRVSLEGAFDAIAKAANGNTGALSRYGIKVNENLSSSEKFAAALAQLEQRFGGLAQAQSKTFEGSLNRIQIAFNEVLKSLGSMITKSPALVAVLNEVGNIIFKVSERIKELTKNGDFIKTIINGFIDFGQGLLKYVIAPLEFTSNLFTVMASAAKLAFDTLNLFNGGTLESVKQSFDALKLSTDNIFNFEKTAGLSTYLEGLKQVANNAPAVGAAITNGVVAPLNKVGDSVTKLTEQLNTSFRQGVVNTISVGAQAIGASLVKGGKAFDNFGKQVLNILGDLAIQMGTTILLASTAIQNLKLAIFGPAGPGIASAIALIAFGGLLKALSGGGGESSGVSAGSFGSGGGGTADIGGGSFAAAVPDQDATRAKGTLVNVNVEGNILDRRESGLEIAKIIQEQFDVNGGVIAQGSFA